MLRDTPVVNSASYSPRLAPGSLVSIFGQYLAVEEQAATGLPLPTELGGASVTLEGRRLPLLYASSEQINAQLPFDVTGTSLLQVTTPSGSAYAGVQVSGVAPAVFSFPSGRSLRGLITHAAGGLVTEEDPATPGEALVVYLTGLGRVEGTVEPGKPAPPTSLRVHAPVTVLVGGSATAPTFAGLTPGFVGLYQINFQVPKELFGGLHALVIAAGSVYSEPVFLPVEGPPVPDGAAAYRGAQLTSWK
jgi:uncharacterized protein (TIGR03437 family)